MEKSHSDSYKQAGVDITAGYKAVQLMQQSVAKTMVPGVLSGLGGFGGLFELDLKDTPNPVLVSGTDGVGTKLRLAFLLNQHNTVGIDCVAMCVNDIICSGAKPLYFLDYIACGKNVPERIADIVSGIAEGCVQSGCALIGGETAEMPGFYEQDEYDLAGFSVGVVDKKAILSNKTMQTDDCVIALPSSGVHSNGFSLVRHVFSLDDSLKAQQNLNGYADVLGKTLGEALLEPTTIYVKPILALLKAITVKGISHITGGGFFENIPRCLPDNLSVEIKQQDVRVPALFDVIQQAGNIPMRDMYNTFNMGVGMCVVVAKEDVDTAISTLQKSGVDAYLLGRVVQGNKEVILC